MSAGTMVLLEMGMEGGALFLMTIMPSFTETFTGSHFVLCGREGEREEGGREGGKEGRREEGGREGEVEESWREGERRVKMDFIMHTRSVI